jgi:hypothetical protein
VAGLRSQAGHRRKDCDCLQNGYPKEDNILLQAISEQERGRDEMSVAMLVYRIGPLSMNARNLRQPC